MGKYVMTEAVARATLDEALTTARKWLEECITGAVAIASLRGSSADALACIKRANWAGAVTCLDRQDFWVPNDAEWSAHREAWRKISATCAEWAASFIGWCPEANTVEGQAEALYEAEVAYLQHRSECVLSDLLLAVGALDEDQAQYHSAWGWAADAHKRAGALVDSSTFARATTALSEVIRCATALDEAIERTAEEACLRHIITSAPLRIRRDEEDALENVARGQVASHDNWLDYKNPTSFTLSDGHTVEVRASAVLRALCPAEYDKSVLAWHAANGLHYTGTSPLEQDGLWVDYATLEELAVAIESALEDAS